MRQQAESRNLGQTFLANSVVLHYAFVFLREWEVASIYPYL